MSFLKFGSLTKKAATAVMVAVAGVLMFAGGAGAANIPDTDLSKMDITTTVPAATDEKGDFDESWPDLTTNNVTSYTVTSVTWAGTFSGTPDAFQNDNAYVATIELTAANTFTFIDATPSTAYATALAALGGYDVVVPAGGATLTFKKRYKIGTAVIPADWLAFSPAAPTDPNVGDKVQSWTVGTADPSFTVGSPLVWKKDGNSLTVDGTTEFEDAGVYLVTVVLTAATGYKFSEGNNFYAAPFTGAVISGAGLGAAVGGVTFTFTKEYTVSANNNNNNNQNQNSGISFAQGSNYQTGILQVGGTRSLPITGVIFGSSLATTTVNADDIVTTNAALLTGKPKIEADPFNGVINITDINLTSATALAVTGTLASPSDEQTLVFPLGGTSITVKFKLAATTASGVPAGGIIVTPATATVVKGGYAEFKLTTTAFGSAPDDFVTVTVSPTPSSSNTGLWLGEAGFAISGNTMNGVTVGLDETQTTLTYTFASRATPAVTATYVVTVANPSKPTTITTTTGAITPADGKVYRTSGSTPGAPRAEIIFLDKDVDYVAGNTKLAIDYPVIKGDAGSSIEDLYVKSIWYDSKDDGCQGQIFQRNGFGNKSSSWHTGVNKVSGYSGDGKPEYNAFVACKYDVVAEVWTTAGRPGAWQGELVGFASAKFTVNARQLTESMITIKLDAPNENIYNAKIKSPRVEVKDGSVWLRAWYESGTIKQGEYAVIAPTDPLEWTNVGIAKVTVEGRRNYKGTVDKKTFEIKARELTFDAGWPYKFVKEYDGTVNVRPEDSTSQTIKFLGYPEGAAELAATDYIIKAGTYKYGDKNVGTNRTVSATVELANTAAAKNYKLKSTSFSTTGQTIEKGTLTSANASKLIATTPKLPADSAYTVKFTGKATSVAAVWASGITNGAVAGVGDGKITVKYSTTDGKPPVDEGSYTITVDVNEGANLKAASGVEIGTVKIDPPGKPTIESITPDTFYYATKSVTLEVKAANPKDGKTTGLSYQWYRQADTGTVTEKGKTAAKFVVNDTAVGPRQYFVKVSYKGTDQDTSSVTSNVISVDVRPAPVTIKGATVTARSSFDYTGNKIVVTGSDFDVMVGSNGLNEGVDYTIKNIANNTNAGENSAVVTLAGINGYKDEVTGTFTINRKQVTLDDLQIAYGVDYTGETQEIAVRPVTGKSGLGAVTPIYTPADTARLNAGSWTVVLNIADGQNFIGIEGLPIAQPYVIRKVLFDDRTMLKRDSLPKEVAWNGKDQGIGAPTLEGLGKKYTGSLRVLYEKNGEDLTTAIDSGVYRVKLNIGGDANFSPFEINLGVLTIHHEGWVGVAQNDRVIPGVVKTEEAAVAPVKTVSASVTAGPNPAASNGKVTFFWNGNTQVSGKLIVFTNVGRKVASINVKGAKEIGSWNVNGVAEGTYLVKGVLREKNGGKVGVSTVVGVTK